MGDADGAVRELLTDLLKQEQMMAELYSVVVRKVRDEKAADVLKGIIADESRHADNARRMLGILDE
jgi:rubrerythrin